MWRPALRWFLPLLLALSSFLPAGSVFAAPSRQGEGLRFTGTVWVTTDPEDLENLEQTTFTNDVEAIYAGIALRWESPEGVEHEVPVEIQFITPNGRPWRDADWYDDDALVISDDFTEDSIARKGFSLAGTDAAEMTGEWSARFLVEGDQVAVLTFNVVSGGNPAETGEVDIEAAVTDQGYEFLGAGSDTSQTEDGEPYAFAWVAMTAVARDLQDERLVQQAYDGFGILNQGFPEVDVYQVVLDYNSQIALLYFAMREGWEGYSNGDIDERTFWNRYAAFAIYDKQQERVLTEEEQKDFQNKNFKGSGTSTDGGGGSAPITPTDLGRGTPANPRVGAVRLEASALSVAADPAERVTITATVIGANNRPIADAEVTFELSGSAGGRLRPASTTTDEDGIAEVTYTPGRDNGTANITASAGGKQATISIQVGEEVQDNPGDAVIAFLENEGYTVHEVGFLEDDPAWPAVVMDAVTPELNEEHLAQVWLGWVALYNSFENTEALSVFLLYDRYAIYWGTETANFEAYVNDEIDGETFSEGVTNVIYDTTTGEEVSGDDFWNKDFTP